MRSLDPIDSDSLSDPQRSRGLRLLILEAAFSATVGVLTSGVLLLAFALQLGASNVMIGVLAAIPFFAQLLQIPAIPLINRVRQRKRIAVWTSVVGRTSLLLVAASIFFLPGYALGVLFLAQIVLCSLGAVGGCAWNSWLRELVPSDRLGQIFGRRLAVLSAIGFLGNIAVATLLALSDRNLARADTIYGALFALGGVFGIASAVVVARMPEPLMPEASNGPSVWGTLAEPFRRPNFRKLLRFTASWQFAANLAAPFLVVMLVQLLGFSPAFALVASSLSQLSNLATLRWLSKIADKFANKTLLAIAVPTYLASLAGMIAATQLRLEAAQIAVLALHLLFGAASAGASLAMTNLTLKISPDRSSTAFGAANAVVTAAAAGVATIVGGGFAEFVGRRELSVIFRWVDPTGLSEWNMTFGPWQFHLALAILLGIYSLHRLSLVSESGSASRRQLLAALTIQMRQSVQNLSTIAGLRAGTVIAMDWRSARTRPPTGRTEKSETL